MSGRSPPLYCTLILITMHSHQSYPNITKIIHSYEYSTTVFVVFVCVFLLLSLERFGRCSSDIFLSSRPRTGLATTYIVLGIVEVRSVNVNKTTVGDDLLVISCRTVFLRILAHIKVRTSSIGTYKYPIMCAQSVLGKCGDSHFSLSRFFILQNSTPAI